MRGKESYVWERVFVPWEHRLFGNVGQLIATHSLAHSKHARVHTLGGGGVASAVNNTCGEGGGGSERLNRTAAQPVLLRRRRRLRVEPVMYFWRAGASLERSLLSFLSSSSLVSSENWASGAAAPMLSSFSWVKNAYVRRRQR